MRLPSDLPESAVRENVSRLITRMGLAHIRHSIIGGEAVRGISGGAQAVNITHRDDRRAHLLFLDEPTSGLDRPQHPVLTTLRQLADQGKTIVLTIRNPGSGL